jgi:hypothetical protein
MKRAGGTLLLYQCLMELEQRRGFENDRQLALARYSANIRPDFAFGITP